VFGGLPVLFPGHSVHKKIVGNSGTFYQWPMSRPRLANILKVTPQGESKSSPLIFFANFWETACNFNIKLYIFILRFQLRFHAK